MKHTQPPPVSGPPAAARDPALAAQLREARLAALLADERRPRRDDLEPSLQSLVQRTEEVYSRALTDHTRQSYASRWRRFTAWTAQQGLTALPASSETVMMYLADAVDSDPPASLSTIRGRLAAINRVHVEAGHSAPGDDPAMGMLMRGIGLVVDRSPRAEPISALRIAQLREVVRSMGEADSRQARDRALLSLAASGVPLDHLSRLQWVDVEAHPTRLRIGLRDRPSEPPSRWRTINPRRDPAVCPVAATADWRGGSPLKWCRSGS